MADRHNKMIKNDEKLKKRPSKITSRKWAKRNVKKNTHFYPAKRICVWCISSFMHGKNEQITNNMDGRVRLL